MESLILSSLVVMMDSGSFVYCCPYDGLPCDRFIDDLGFGACFVRRLNGKVCFVCPRFSAKKDVSVSEDLVPWCLIPK